MVPQIQPRDLKHILDSGEPVSLLDVRQPEENADLPLCRAAS